MDVFAVGVGSDVDQNELRQITRFQSRVFQADNPSLLAREFRQIQQDIRNLADSFYWINYITPKRFNIHNIELKVDGNNLTGNNSVLRTSFSAEGFSDVDPQVVINQDFPEIFGAASISLPANRDTVARAVTILSGKAPSYEWKSSDERIVEVELLNNDGSRAKIRPRGEEGNTAIITITDINNTDLRGNLLTRSIPVVLGEAVQITELTAQIAGAEIGRFSFDEFGAVMDITSNTGDGFEVKAGIGENPGGTLPETIEKIFNKRFWTFSIKSVGIPNISFNLEFDIRAFAIDNPDRLTVLYRSDRSSDWVDLSDSIGINVQLENESLTVAGLTSFSEFALAEQVLITSVDDIANNIPQNFSLRQNYPNPFNPSTTIEYSLPNAVEVRLTVHDILGRQLAMLVNQRQSAGFHSINFNASALASGMYLYRIEAGNFTQTRKLMLVK